MLAAEDPLIGLTFIVALLTLLVAVAALGIASRELKSVETASKAEALKLILAPLDDPYNRKTRYLVLRDDWPSGPELPIGFSDDASYLDAADIDERVRQLGYAYDTLSIFVLKKFVDEKIVREIHGDGLVIVWQKLTEFILKERERRPKYGTYWQELADRWDKPV